MSFRAFLGGIPLCLALVVATPAVAQEYFDHAREFPNHFLPAQYRALPPAQVPPAVVRASRERVERALLSIFQRIEIPIVLPGEGETKMVKYFPEFQRLLREIDPAVKIYPSGGVVRAALGYLYDQMVQGARSIPPQSGEAVLNRIASDRGVVPSLDVRGVGSDWDVLISTQTRRFDDLRERALRFTNGAESHYGFTDTSGAVKRGLFTVADVKDYRAQTDLSTSQGGSTLDFLAFDLETQRFKEPEQVVGIVDDFIRGRYSYVAPGPGERVRDAAKQTVRGIRPMLELPFLALKDESQLRSELDGLMVQAQRGLLTDKALEQFDKMVRNARFSGAHNRFYRSRSGTIDAQVAQLNEVLRNRLGRALIPEFVDRFPLTGKPQLPEQGLPGLISMEEFRTRVAPQGVLYHGTPSPESGMAIVRKGLFVGDQRQGTAVFGRGAYTSPVQSVAQEYAGAQGIVFGLRVREDPDIRILDLAQARRSSRFTRIEQDAARSGRDLHEFLARDYGIDIIINHHVLVQNLEAVEFPSGIQELIQTYARRAQSPNVPLEARYQALEDFGRLYEYSRGLGSNQLPSPSVLREQFLADVKSVAVSSETSTVDRVLAVALWGRSDPDPAEISAHAHRALTRFYTEVAEREGAEAPSSLTAFRDASRAASYRNDVFNLIRIQDLSDAQVIQLLRSIIEFEPSLLRGTYANVTLEQYLSRIVQDPSFPSRPVLMNELVRLLSDLRSEVLNQAVSGRVMKRLVSGADGTPLPGIEPLLFKFLKGSARGISERRELLSAALRLQPHSPELREQLIQSFVSPGGLGPEIVEADYSEVPLVNEREDLAGLRVLSESSDVHPDLIRNGRIQDWLFKFVRNPSATAEGREISLYAAVILSEHVSPSPDLRAALLTAWEQFPAPRSPMSRQRIVVALQKQLFADRAAFRRMIPLLADFRFMEALGSQATDSNFIRKVLFEVDEALRSRIPDSQAFELLYGVSKGVMTTPEGRILFELTSPALSALQAADRGGLSRYKRAMIRANLDPEVLSREGFQVVAKRLERAADRNLVLEELIRAHRRWGRNQPELYYLFDQVCGMPRAQQTLYSVVNAAQQGAYPLKSGQNAAIVLGGNGFSSATVDRMIQGIDRSEQDSELLLWTARGRQADRSLPKPRFRDCLLDMIMSPIRSFQKP